MMFVWTCNSGLNNLKQKDDVMSRVCQLTGTRANNGMAVSLSLIHI